MLVVISVMLSLLGIVAFGLLCALIADKTNPLKR